jgi:hypothetical protein
VNEPCRPFVLLASYVFVVGGPDIAERGCGMTREALGEFEQMVVLAMTDAGEA